MNLIGKKVEFSKALYPSFENMQELPDKNKADVYVFQDSGSISSSKNCQVINTKSSLKASRSDDNQLVPLEDMLLDLKDNNRYNL